MPYSSLKYQGCFIPESGRYRVSAAHTSALPVGISFYSFQGEVRLVAYIVESSHVLRADPQEATILQPVD